MAEMEDKLKSLLNDEDSMKRVLEMASALMGSSSQEDAGEAAAPVPAPAATSTAEPAPTSSAAPAAPSPSSMPDLSSLLSLIGGGGQSSPGGAAQEPQSGAGGLSGLGGLAGGSAAAALPALLQSFSGQKSFIKEERLNLVKAMKPYLADSRGASIDRAIKMANMAKAAKSALALLGR